MKKQLVNNYPKDEILSSASISDCGKYRYSLTRVWDESKPKIMFTMLNPSTADATTNDPTIIRCINFSKSWGYGGLFVCNLFAYRATDPRELLKVNDPFGAENLFHTTQLANQVETIICAWGNQPILKKILKDHNPNKLLKFAQNKLHYLKLSKDGIPMHPLYLRADILPLRFEGDVP